MTKTGKLMAAVGTTAIALAFVPVVAGATAGSSGRSDHRTLHVVEHAVTDTVQQFHPPANSLGDVLGFHNPVYDATDTMQVGNDNGFCIRTVATGKTEWECNWTTQLKDGSVTVEGPYYDDGTNTILTITGGTGEFAWARGSMLLQARGNPLGSEYDFIFNFGGTRSR